MANWYEHYQIWLTEECAKEKRLILFQVICLQVALSLHCNIIMNIFKVEMSGYQH